MKAGTATIEVNGDTTQLLAGLEEVEAAVERIIVAVGRLNIALKSLAAPPFTGNWTTT